MADQNTDMPDLKEREREREYCLHRQNLWSVEKPSTQTVFTELVSYLKSWGGSSPINKLLSFILSVLKLTTFACFGSQIQFCCKNVKFIIRDTENLKVRLL